MKIFSLMGHKLYKISLMGHRYHFFGPKKQFSIENKHKVIKPEERLRVVTIQFGVVVNCLNTQNTLAN